jgi:hypothetical protein
LKILVNGNFTTNCSPGTVDIQFNGDTGNNYTNVFNPAGISGTGKNTAFASGGVLGSNSDWGGTTMEVMGLNTSTFKTVNGLGIYGDGPNNFQGSGIWKNTATVTSFDILNRAGCSYSAGDTITVYGMN